MRTLVSGSAGFIGSWIADELAKHNHEVIGMDDLSGGFMANVRAESQQFERINLATRKGRELVEEAAPEVVFHLAANACEGASHYCPADITLRNMMAFANTIEGAIAGGNLKRFVLFSSMARYGKGFPDPPPFAEDEHLPQPEDIYGHNKACMEACLEVLAEVHGFPYVIVVPHNVYGERQCLNNPQRNVLAIWMNSIMLGQPVIIYGDGNQKRAFSYIRDSLPSYVLALTKGDGEVINIGGETPVTINEAAELVLAAMKPQFKSTSIIHVADRPREVKEAYCTVEKSQRILGFVDQTSLAEGINRMAAWSKKLGGQRWRPTRLPLQNALTPRPWIPGDPLYKGGLSAWARPSKPS